MKYKSLKSVAHNWAASFASTLNYFHTDYGMGHLCRIAAGTGIPDFNVDLLTGQASPEIFLSEYVKLSLHAWIPKFKEMLTREIPDVSGITAAKFSVHFDLAGISRPKESPHYRVPCKLTVSIADDKGKSHEAVISDAWHVEQKTT